MSSGIDLYLDAWEISTVDFLRTGLSTMYQFKGSPNTELDRVLLGSYHKLNTRLRPLEGRLTSPIHMVEDIMKPVVREVVR